MRHVRHLAGRQAALAYFAVTFAVSWGGLLAIGGVGGMSGSTWQSDPRLPLMVVAMLAGPAAAGVLLTALTSGRSGFRQLGARLFRWRAGARWYAVALLTAPLGFLVVHSLLSLAAPAFRPIVLTVSGKAAFIASSVAGAFAVGVCEELGWTGFATPTLRQRHGVLATGLIVGVPWGAWHLLTNDLWIARSYSGGLSPGTFALLNGLSLVFGQLPAYRVLMTYVYERTDSLLIAMLMHASLSACTFVLGPEKVTGLALVGYGFALAGAWWLVVGIAWLAGDFGRACAGGRWPTGDGRRATGDGRDQ